MMNALLPQVPPFAIIAKPAGPTTPVRTGTSYKTPTAFATPEYYGKHITDSSGWVFLSVFLVGWFGGFCFMVLSGLYFWGFIFCFLQT